MVEVGQAAHTAMGWVHATVKHHHLRGRFSTATHHQAFPRKRTMQQERPTCAIAEELKEVCLSSSTQWRNLQDIAIHLRRVYEKQLNKQVNGGSRHVVSG